MFGAMKSDLSHLEGFSIFWSESSTYISIYAAYALIVCVVVCFIEFNLQKGANVDFYKLGLSSTSLAIVAILLFSASMLISGWYSSYVGGEVLAFLVTLVVTGLSLVWFKVFLIGHYSLPYESAMLASIYISAILIAPYALFFIFNYVLGSAFRI